MRNGPERFIPEDNQLESESNSKINFESVRLLRPKDITYYIPKAEDRKYTNEDWERGIYDAEDKVNFATTKLLDGLPFLLSNPDNEMSPEKKESVETLRSGKAVFLPLEVSQIDEQFAKAAEKFTESKPGIILLANNKSLMYTFSGIRYEDGHFARLSRTGPKEDLAKTVESLNYLTPQLEAREINDEETAYAIEFVQNAEEPTTITNEEIEDWLQRVKQSGLTFEFDVSKKDESHLQGGLDNFVRKDGKLLWVDGNILGAKLTQNDEELETFIDKQREILETYRAR